MVIRKTNRHKKRFYSKQGNKVTERTARKEHRCKECGGDINYGERYREINYKDDSGHHTVRFCKECWKN